MECSTIKTVRDDCGCTSSLYRALSTASFPPSLTLRVPEYPQMHVHRIIIVGLQPQLEAQDKSEREERERDGNVDTRRVQRTDHSYNRFVRTLPGPLRMHEERIHGPTINPAHPPPRAHDPGLGNGISAGRGSSW